MNVPPQIPELPVEAHLEIFLHPSGLSQTLDRNNKFSNGRRLEVLGRKMAEVAYLDVMHKRWPRVTAEQLTVRWGFAYEASGKVDQSLMSPADTRQRHPTRPDGKSGPRL